MNAENLIITHNSWNSPTFIICLHFLRFILTIDSYFLVCFCSNEVKVLGRGNYSKNGIKLAVNYQYD